MGKGSVIYDSSFDLFKEIGHLCRLCKAIAGNSELVKPGGAQCLPSGARGASAWEGGRMGARGPRVGSPEDTRAWHEHGCTPVSVLENIQSFIKGVRIFQRRAGACLKVNWHRATRAWGGVWRVGLHLQE